MDDCIYARFFGPKWAKMAIFDVFDQFLEPNMAGVGYRFEKCGENRLQKILASAY